MITLITQNFKKVKQFKTVLQFSVLLSFLWIFSNNAFAQGNALGLDGNNDFADCGNHSSLDITGTSITLEAWVYSTSFTTNVWQGNVVNKSGNGDFGYMLRVGNNGQVNFNIGNGAWNEINSPTGTVALNTWHHIAGTYDGTTMRLYVDGVEVATGPLTGNIGFASNNLLFGDDPQFTGRYFPGRIDEVRIWNTTRTAQEIIEDMNNNACSNYPTGLVAYYKFNQGVANGNNAGLTTINEEIGVGNGTIINSSLNGAVSNWVEGVYLSTSDSSLTICQGDSVLIGGSYQTTSGTYFDSLQTINGCDSLIRITLAVTPSVVTNNNATICQGDSILLGGAYQTTTGIYVDTLQAASGCDSLISTTLIVLVPASVSVTAQICQGDSILLGGAYQTTAGNYMDSLKNTMGCDSVILTTTLSIISTVTSTDTIRICQGDSVLIAGVYQSTAGTYSDTLQSTAGCDSIHQQTLVVYPSPNVILTAFSPDTLCDNGAPIPLPAATPAGGSYSGNGVSGANFDPAISGPGIHYVAYTYTDANNCTATDSTMITVNICLGVEAINAETDFNIFPNPAQDVLTIQSKTLPTSPLQVSIVDALGRTVKQAFIGSNRTTNLDVSTLNAGIYFVVISTKNQTVVHKISKRKS